MDKSAIQEIADLLARSQQVSRTDVNGIPHVIIPHDHRVEGVEKLLPTPIRKRNTPSFYRQESFIAYVNDHKTPATRLYVPGPTQIVAVIDHQGENPSWAEHKATLNLQISPEWKTWTGKNATRMPQRDFAQFIEDNYVDISHPHGADLLDTIRNIKASVNLDCTGEIDERGDQKGQSFVLTTRTKTGAKGELEIPGEFRLSISPYDGGISISVLVRLRFEIQAPRLVLWYEIVQRERTERDALDVTVNTVAAETKLEAWFGAP